MYGFVCMDPRELSALINVIIRQHTIMVTFRSALEALNVNVEGTRVDLDDPTICPACHKRLKTAQGVMAHLSSAVRCQWYRKGKLKALTLPGQFAEETVTQEVEAPLPGIENDEEDGADPAIIMQDHYDQLFDLLPSSNVDSNIGNEPGPSRRHWHIPAEDDEDGDERIIIEHPTAGQIIRMDETLHERWKKIFRRNDIDEDVLMDGGDDSNGERDDNKWAPFASELDWRVARWAVQEGVGHKSFDRLMAIPGVSFCAIYYIFMALCS